MSSNPYLITDSRPHVLCFSGGRSSGYMLAQTVEAYGGTLPENIVVMFNNTGKEREQTLVFVNRCQEFFDVPIVWTEYEYRANARGGMKDPKASYRVVDYASASRAGQPYRQAVAAQNRIPNMHNRICTVQLKILTTQRYMYRERGKNAKQFTRIVGFRADEPRRIKKAVFNAERTCRLPQYYPMVHAGVSEHDVLAYWRRMPFDLELEAGMSNCTMCMLNGKVKLLRKMRREPGECVWWIDLEESYPGEFRQDHSYRKLRSIAENTPELPLDDDDSVNCFCTD